MLYSNAENRNKRTKIINRPESSDEDTELAKVQMFRLCDAQLSVFDRIELNLFVTKWQMSICTFCTSPH